MPHVWTDWGAKPDPSAPSGYSFVRFKDGRQAAKCAFAGKSVIWRSIGDCTEQITKRDDESGGDFLLRALCEADIALASQGAPPAWHKVAETLERRRDRARLALAAKP